MPVQRRWRQVQVIDEGWSYEEEDPSFVAPKAHDDFKPFFHGDQKEEVDGWHPIGAVWKYCYGTGDKVPPPNYREQSRGYKPKVSDRPWRTHIDAEGPQGPRRDFPTREAAMADIEERTGSPK